MRLIQFLILLICLTSANVSAQEGDSFSLFSKLQEMGITLGQSNQQELLPPDQAFKLSVEVRDAHTLIANFTPAKDYYLYRDKVAFEPRDTDIVIERIALPPGKMKDDLTFGETEVYYKPFQAIISLKREISETDEPLMLAATYQGCNDPIGVCYAPIHEDVNLTLPPALTAAVGLVAEAVSGNATAAVPDATEELFQMRPGIPAIETESYKIDRMFETGNFWLILTGFFGIGLLLSFTPCVFPMFPILTGIIANRGEHLTKMRGFTLALVYVLGMAITYAAAGVAAGLSGEMLSAALQNAWVLGTFALVFVLLSFSMFGFYELQIPGSLQNKLSAEAGHLKGGHISGVFGMGALSALIVGPCVAAPLAGALLYISQTRDVVLGGSALFVMALGMGVPLLLLGASAGALLPKAGAWMVSIKQFFGVLLLAVAIWLISPVITEVVHMLLWAALFIISAIYLHAIDPLPERASGLRRFLKGVGVISLLMGVALLIGVLSGSRDVLQPLSKLNMANASYDNAAYVNAGGLLPFQAINSIAELDEKIQQSEGKYVMVDFYADWCISCKVMEREVFSQPEAAALMSNFILVQADVTNNDIGSQQLLENYNLFGPPSILFFDADGGELIEFRVMGELNEEQFVKHLNEVLGKLKGAA